MPTANISEARAATPGAPQEPKMNYFQKVWNFRRYLVIEPFFFFYVAASYLNSIAMRNFPLEKACRVNLEYNALTCTTTLDKSILGIECDSYSFENTTLGPTPEMRLVTVDSPLFNETVCKAEYESQILYADILGKRAPIAAIFSLIVLLFAGGWSDRYNKRKPCMIVPIIGECLSFICLLISAVFFDSLPLEFGAYLEGIVPSLFGGLTFTLMAIYSYITQATPEEDRVFRFGIFAMLVTALPFTSIVSGELFLLLGYINSFAMAASFQVIAILYIVFFIKELKPLPPTTKAEPNGNAPAMQRHAADNMAYETTNVDELPVNKNVNFKLTPQMEPPPPPAPPRRSLCKELFDPTLLLDCFKFPMVKRENNGRALLLLIMLAYFFTTAPALGEGEYWYPFSLKALNWNGNDNSIYNAVNGGLALIGTFLGTAIMHKMLKFSDSVIGMWSAIFMVISRFVFAYSTTTAMYYTGAVFDMFATLRVIAIKTIGSSIVEGDELGKMYAIFGISEPIGQFIFPPIYSAIYIAYLDSFPGAVFLFSEIFSIPNVLVFIVCYFMIRHRNAKDNSVELAQNNEEKGRDNAGTEITSL